MFPIKVKHIGKIEAVGTMLVFGYSARRIDRMRSGLPRFRRPADRHRAGFRY